MQLRKIYRSKHGRILILAFVSILIAGCGGDGSSSSSGSSSGDPSSTLVMSNGSSGGISAVLEPQLLDGVNRNLLEQFTQFILPSAWASINVFLNGFSYGSTDDNAIMIAVTAGTYTLRLVDDGPPEVICTTSLNIGNDEIVSVTLDMTANDCIESIQRDPVDDDLIAGGDNAPAGKTLACHKNKQIAISFNALDAHLAHGDTAGPCSKDQSVAVDDQDSDDDDSEDDDEEGGKPDKPDNPNKPVKA